MLDRPGRASVASTAIAEWDLERLDGDSLARVMTRIAGFVAQLKADDVDVPRCWYVHGWVRQRLAALCFWREEEYATAARKAADWWAIGIATLARDWEPLQTHGSSHPDPSNPGGGLVALPPFADVRACLVERARSGEET